MIRISYIFDMEILFQHLILSSNCHYIVSLIHTIGIYLVCSVSWTFFYINVMYVVWLHLHTDTYNISHYIIFFARCALPFVPTEKSSFAHVSNLYSLCTDISRRENPKWQLSSATLVSPIVRPAWLMILRLDRAIFSLVQLILSHLGDFR